MFSRTERYCNTYNTLLKDSIIRIKYVDSCTFLLGACVGAVVGLVAITPAAGYVSVGASLFIGTVASIISNLAVHWKNQSTLDDTLDVFPCHGIGGIVGVIATGIFAQDVGLAFGKTETFFYHLLSIVL